jgi:putative aldouronate transport system substrate-binding protein
MNKGVKCMNKKSVRILAIFVASIMFIASFAGCAAKDPEVKENTTTVQQSTSTTSEAETTAPVKEKKEDITVKVFYGPPDVNIGAIVGNNPDNAPVVQESDRMFKEKYGYNIKREYIFCGQDETIQKLQLMISSGDIPDVMPGISYTYPGGASAAGRDGIIADFMKYKENIPNIVKLFEEQPMLAKQLKTDEGALYSVGDVRVDRTSSIFFGPVIRKDLLDKAGLPLPETIDEWYNALKTFKANRDPHQWDAIVWFLGYSNAFASVWDGAGYPQADGGSSIIIDDSGKAVYGAGSEGFKNFLTEFNKWYNEGLFNIEAFTSGDWGAYNARYVNKKAAGGVHFLGELKSINDEARKTIPEFQLAGAKYPVLNKGDKPRMGQWDPMGIPGSYINAASKYIPQLLDEIDFRYSEEGIRLHNYGIDGKTYTMVDGKPQFNDYLFFEGEKNKDGLTFNQAWQLNVGGGSVFLPEVWLKSNTNTKEKVEAVPLWDDVQRPANELRFISFKPLEQELVKKRVDLDTYASEQMIKFITGSRPLSEYDAYVNELKTKFRMDEIINVYNIAFDRYKNR